MQGHLQQQVQAALESKQPRQNLRALAEQFKAQGHSQIEIYLVFKAPSLLISKDTQQDADEEWRFDALLEVLDEIYGWCSQRRKLFPDQSIDEEQLEEQRRKLWQGEK